MFFTIFGLILVGLCCIFFYYMGILTIWLMNHDDEEER